MKTFYFLISLFIFQFLIGCSNTVKQVEENKINKIDTLVGEYHSHTLTTKNYLIINSDTSDLFIYVDKFGDPPKLSIDIEEKPSHPFFEYIIKNNIAISGEKEFPSDSLSYDQKIQELKYLFNYLSKTNDLSTLKWLRFDVANINGLTDHIGKTLLQRIDSLEDYYFALRSIESTVKESNIISDLNKIFSLYGLTIDKTNIWEGKFMGNLDDLIALHKGDKQKLSKAISNELLISCFISVKIKHK